MMFPWPGLLQRTPSATWRCTRSYQSNLKDDKSEHWYYHFSLISFTFFYSVLVLARFGSVWFREPFMWTLNRTGGSVWFLFRLHNQWFCSGSVQVWTGLNHFIMLYYKIIILQFKIGQKHILFTDLNTTKHRDSMSSSSCSSKLFQNVSSSSRVCSWLWFSLPAEIVLDLYLCFKIWISSNVMGSRWFLQSVLVIPLLENTRSSATKDPCIGR